MNRLVRVRNDHNKTMSASLSSKTNTDQLITKQNKNRAKFPKIVFPNQLADKAQQLVEWCPGATIKC
jgi:hypothetical protein